MVILVVGFADELTEATVLPRPQRYQMIDNFDVAMTRFEADVRAGKANIRVAKRGSSGGGSFAPLSLGLLAMLIVARRRTVQRVA